MLISANIFFFLVEINVIQAVIFVFSNIICINLALFVYSAFLNLMQISQNVILPCVLIGFENILAMQ